MAATALAATSATAPSTAPSTASPAAAAAATSPAAALTSPWACLRVDAAPLNQGLAKRLSVVPHRRLSPLGQRGLRAEPVFPLQVDVRGMQVEIGPDCKLGDRG